MQLSLHTPNYNGKGYGGLVIKDAEGQPKGWQVGCSRLKYHLMNVLLLLAEFLPT